jgi:hypothetical protein
VRTGPVALPARIQVQPEPSSGDRAIVAIHGRVERRDVVDALERLEQQLRAQRGGLLIDARDMQGYTHDCAAVLADWIAARGGMQVRCVAVVVRGRAHFVRATRALATATGIGWLITDDRAGAERWLASAMTDAP